MLIVRNSFEKFETLSPIILKYCRISRIEYVLTKPLCEIVIHQFFKSCFLLTFTTFYYYYYYFFLLKANFYKLF